MRLTHINYCAMNRLHVCMEAMCLHLLWKISQSGFDSVKFSPHTAPFSEAELPFLESSLVLYEARLNWRVQSSFME